MIDFRIVPIPETITDHVHTTLTDPIYQFPVQITIANVGDYGPCQICLNTFSIGERRILFLYNPFSVQQEPEFAGPVFIHAERCRPYASRRIFPESIRTLPISLRGYDAHNHFVAEEQPRSLNVETAIETLLRRAEIVFLHVRNIEEKCFILHIERV
ncbi:MAG TPA: DUF1203 domain-containing protein [Ktedonobacteraceae bacterium]|jgi:hypothetical protein